MFLVDLVVLWRRSPCKNGECGLKDLNILGETNGREAGSNEVTHKSMVDGRWIHTPQTENLYFCPQFLEGLNLKY